MPPVWLEPAAPRSRVKHSRSDDEVMVTRFFKIPQERCDLVSDRFAMAIVVDLGT